MKKKFFTTLIFVLLSVIVIIAANTHISTSGTLPTNCNVGDVYYKTGTSAGFYTCSASNTWTLTSGGSGTVTNTGTLTSGQLIFGNGGADITVGNLSGDISTSGSGVTTIGASKVTNSMLAGSIAASKLIGTDIATVGTITSGTWTGTTIAFANGGTGLTSALDDTTLVSSGTAWVATTLPDCIDTGGNHLNYTQATNAFSCGTSGGGGGSSALSGITAAVAGNTIASGNNSGQVWNWALTSNSVTAFSFGETTAASGGTSDNQVLVGINTLASSTAVPLYIKHYGSADAFRIDDVSGDTTPFLIDNTGHVGIGGAPDANTSLYVAPNGTFFAVRFDTGSAQIGTYTGGWGTINNVDYKVLQNQFIRLQFATNQVTRLDRSGTAPTSISGTSQFLQIGNDDRAANSYYLIGFGFSNDTFYANPPAYIGFKDLSGSSFTHGDLIFGTRSTDTNVAATERMRITNDGFVQIASLKTTGSAGTKNVVCVDTTTGNLYASSTGTDCSN